MTTTINLRGDVKYSIFHGKTIFQVTDLQYLKGEVNYTKIHLKGKSPVISAYTLKVFQEQLPGNQFIRPNKSTLLNIDFVEGITKTEVILKNKERVKISRRRLEHVQEVMNIKKA